MYVCMYVPVLITAGSQTESRIGPFCCEKSQRRETLRLIDCHCRCRYHICDELIWVKTNQLQRLIRTGRTGHWLNHGKEHCLVGGN